MQNNQLLINVKEAKDELTLPTSLGHFEDTEA